MGAGLLIELAPITSRGRNELEFGFETFNVNLRDTILIPLRDVPLEDMSITDFCLVRYSEMFPLEYAGAIPMRFLQRWDIDSMFFKNWTQDGPKGVTVEDIYTILSEIDAVLAKAPMTRDEHAVAMGNIVKMRDFVAYVANQERDVQGDKAIEGDIALNKTELGIEKK